MIKSHSYVTQFDFEQSLAKVNATLDRIAKRSELFKKEQEEYEAKRKKEEEEYEAKRKKEEEEYEAKRKKEEEIKKKKEEEYEAKRKKEEEIKKKKEEEYEAKRKKEKEEYEKQRAKIEAKLERMGISFGNFQNNIAESTEEMFYEGLLDKKEINNIKFDAVYHNMKDGQREYDIVMKNGKYIAIIEVKQKAHVNDIDDLKNKQVKSFKENFKLSDKKKILLGLASPVLTPVVRKKAEEEGIFLLSQNGENVEVKNSTGFEPKAY
jgi:chromosome segregation ATPase